MMRVLRSGVSIGVIFRMKASAVGPHLPLVSRTKGMRCGWLSYLERFCCSRSHAAVASRWARAAEGRTAHAATTEEEEEEEEEVRPSCTKR